MSEQETTTEMPQGILAARCPPGWRRDPLTGRPVMPCLGKLLFPCAPDEIPTHFDVRSNLQELWYYTDSLKSCWAHLIGAVIGDARINKMAGRDGLSQDTEKYLADCIDEVLRTCRGTVRIVKTAAGWEEVVGDAAAK